MHLSFSHVYDRVMTGFCHRRCTLVEPEKNRLVQLAGSNYQWCGGDGEHCQ